MTDDMPLSRPYHLGPYDLPHRATMAPMGRNRAEPHTSVPAKEAVTYYRQRASAGFIITESTQVSWQGVGYPRTPGIHTPEQVAGWKNITDALHEEGCRIFVQLWHVGRMSHPEMQKDGALPVAPSAVAPSTGQAMTYEGQKSFVVPRALETNEIPGIVADYRHAAQCAMEAGFDGIEVVCAGGWLMDQFLRDGTNKRTDVYGGSIENRMRLPLETIEACIEVWGEDRVGVQISPWLTINDISDSDTEATCKRFVQELERLRVVYLFVIEMDKFNREPPSSGALPALNTYPPDWGAGKYAKNCKPLVHNLREIFSRTLILNSDYGRDNGNAAIESGIADLIGYGRWWLANPDLFKRFQLSAPRNLWDTTTFYGGDKKGYTDYPLYDDAGPDG